MRPGIVAPLLLALSCFGSAHAAVPGLPVSAMEGANSAPTVAVGGGTTRVAVGQMAPLQLTVYVPPGFHVYRDMLRVDLVDPGDLSLGTPSLPPGLSAPDPASPGDSRELYEFDAIIDIPLVAPAQAGEHLATFSVRYQACHDGFCLMPRSAVVEARLVVTAP